MKEVDLVELKNFVEQAYILKDKYLELHRIYVEVSMVINDIYHKRTLDLCTKDDYKHLDKLTAKIAAIITMPLMSESHEEIKHWAIFNEQGVK